MSNYLDNLNFLIDLHLHLDGAISIESAKKLAEVQNIDIPKTDAELINLMRVDDDCCDLNQFLEKFAFPCSLIQTEIGLKMAVKNLLDELEEQGLMYVEIRFAPQLSTNKGLTQEQIVDYVIEASKGHSVSCNFILCCMRGADNKEKNYENIDVAKKFLNKGVVAADLAGAEALFPNEDYKDIFEYAQKLGVPFVLHAGEAAGPDSVLSAIKMGAKRIGHGVNARKDKNIMKLLAEQQIPLEMCPTSTINTAIFKSISEFPVVDFLKNGIFVTINTDDPSIEGTTLRDEFKKLIKEFNFSPAQIKQLLNNSVVASFVDSCQKAKLTEAINKQFSNL